MSPTASESHYVFISFASADAELAHRAVAALEGVGLRSWIADRDIEMSTSYPAAITAAIKGCGALLLLLTEVSNASPHVLREVELAFNARRPILPVRIAGATPSSDLQYFLSTSQWLDAGPAFDNDDLEKIEPVLRELLERGRLGEVIRSSGSRGWLWVGVAAAVIVAISIWAMFFTRADRERLASTAARGGTESPRPEGVAAPNLPVSADGRNQPAKPAVPPAATQPATKVNPHDGQAYVWIGPGGFVMGCSDGDAACESDEKPPHRVDITRGFWLSRTEVTVSQYRKAMTAGGAAPATASSTELPVTEVNWASAKAYCARIGGRLPTEAEWEYAARGGTTTRYYDSLRAIAWFTDNSDGHPHPVGTRAPNAFGLHDMLGNVSEWVLDRYYNTYDDTSDPAAPDQPLAGNASGVARGGSFLSASNGLRVSRRLELPPDAEEPHVGFRCAVDRL